MQLVITLKTVSIWGMFRYSDPFYGKTSGQNASKIKTKQIATFWAIWILLMSSLCNSLQYRKKGNNIEI